MSSIIVDAATYCALSALGAIWQFRNIQPTKNRKQHWHKVVPLIVGLP